MSEREPFYPHEYAERTITELEHENLGLRRFLEDAKAEIAGMKARRCWTCRYHVYLSHGGNAYQYPECPLYGEVFEADGFCHRWTDPVTP